MQRTCRPLVTSDPRHHPNVGVVEGRLNPANIKPCQVPLLSLACYTNQHSMEAQVLRGHSALVPTGKLSGNHVLRSWRPLKAMTRTCRSPRRIFPVFRCCPPLDDIASPSQHLQSIAGPHSCFLCTSCQCSCPLCSSAFNTLPTRSCIFLRRDGHPD